MVPVDITEVVKARVLWEFGGGTSFSLGGGLEPLS